MGCSTTIILVLIWGLLVSKFGEIGGFLIFFSPIIILMVWSFISDDSISNDPETLENINESIRLEKESIRKERGEDVQTYERHDSAIDKIDHVTYEGGHESYAEIEDGELYLYDNEIEFYSISLGIIFTVPIDQIKNVKYDLAEDISMKKLIVFGLGSFALKDKTYYLIIDYVSKNGIDNQVVFNTGKNKEQFFINKLNVLRNLSNSKTIKKTTANLGHDSSIESIKQLSELKDKGILTEEEFSEKKKQILDKM